MKKFELKGEIRSDFGKKAANSLRSKNLIPCNVYGGKDSENISFSVKNGDILKLIYTPDVFVVNLTLGDREMKAVIKEVQFHPVKDQAIHIDFLHVYDKIPVVVDIPVRLIGLAPGVKAGGKLTADLRKLKAKALYNDLPETLDIDVTKLKLGKSIQVGQLKFKNVEILNPNEAVVCRVQTTRVVADPTLDAEEEEAEEKAEEAAEEASHEGHEGHDGHDGHK